MTEPPASSGPPSGGRPSPTPPEQLPMRYLPTWNVAPPPPRERHIAGMVVLGGMISLVAIGLIAIALTSREKPTGETGGSPASPSASAHAVVARHVLFVFRGSGSRVSAPFDVGHGPLTVRYRFNCASSGGAGSFRADALHGDQRTLNSDELSIANALARRGHHITTIHPRYPGKKYRLKVNSECSWHIIVTGR